MSEPTESARKEIRQKTIEAAIENDSVPKMYANGFTLVLSNADIQILFQRLGRPVGMMGLSYTLAKTLAQKLGGLVAEWESSMGQEIATTDKIDRLVAIKKADTKGE